ncbi:hypothetical protein [Campylobacter sp. JMF_08 NE1]|uniref:hypothetical protein n=1 Tax=Campylobacter sp. JMF_08 NE1 TaxID=2983821 RepID=UPI0022E9987B|nr:hypothetical protein [Campylobacter sp. JMF_08 NE1]MDA3048722.1 hypothetical protein [Campylobacter sp. JMF_08 NE1]
MQRDYDKEPLVLKDYSLYVIIYFACLPIMIFMVSLIYDIKIGLVTIAFLVFGIQDLQEFVKNKDKISVKFTNTSIIYAIDKTTKNTINLNDITEITKTLSLAYGKNTIEKNKVINKKLLFLGIGLILIAWLFLATKFLLILLSLILSVVLFINFLSNLFVNKTLSLKFWKEYKIFDNNHRYVNFVIKNSDYLELKTYFLLKTGKNLDDIKISINYLY